MRKNAPPMLPPMTKRSGRHKRISVTLPPRKSKKIAIAKFNRRWCHPLAQQKICRYRTILHWHCPNRDPGLCVVACRHHKSVSNLAPNLYWCIWPGRLNCHATLHWGEKFLCQFIISRSLGVVNIADLQAGYAMMTIRSMCTIFVGCSLHDYTDSGTYSSSHY